ncbi:MAG TPA: hypothetical protein VNO30_05965 [Kofleriaceae bacterium]|nr:hypothetical protein [Kofleriaceae bacterium]
MIQFDRPTRPSDFEATVREHRAVIAKAAARRQPLDWSARDVWKKYKGLFSAAQHRKCGYCESKTAASQDGDVEHLAPKGEIWSLPNDPRKWGVEAEAGLARLEAQSRERIVISTRGYWYLAYEWHNYVFACNVCNSKYKLSFYPLKPRPRKGWAPSKRSRKHKTELLNCFDHPAPWRHFSYNVTTGTIGWKTPEGRATVATCGLFRETLRQDRFEVIHDAERLCCRIADDPNEINAWLDLVEIGGEDRSFAGAVRGVAEDLLELNWEEIEAHALALAHDR